MAERLNEMSEVAQKHYNLAQIHLIKYQLLMGIISNELEYSDSAEVFAMMANRVITIPKKVDWSESRAKVQELVSDTRSRFKFARGA